MINLQIGRIYLFQINETLAAIFRNELISDLFSPKGNPPALPEDSRSLTTPGVVAESVFREPLKVYERDRPCKRMRV